MDLSKIIGSMKNHSREEYENHYDVQLLIDGRCFKCHRAPLAYISEYLYYMFSSSDFTEPSATPDRIFPLSGIDAAAFDELLHCMFTGNLRVKDSNVFQLLVLDDFLKLRPHDFKEKCVEFLIGRSRKPDPIANVFDLLSFARSKGEEVLFHSLFVHVCGHLYHFSMDARVMEISFETLNALLIYGGDYILPLPGSSDVLLANIHHWFNHNRAERSRYLGELLRNIDYSHVSSDFLISLIMRLENGAGEADSQSFTESRTLEMGLDPGNVGGNARFSATIPLKVNNMYAGRFSETSEPARTISNLLWTVCVEKMDDEVSVCVQCDGAYLSSEWNCYANAIFTVKSHKEGGEDYVAGTRNSLFSSASPRFAGCLKYLEYDDLVNPVNGFIEDDDSMTIYTLVQADVPFLTDRGEGESLVNYVMSILD